MSTLHLRGPVAVLLAVLSASCSTIGENDFACPGRPPGVRCMSATEVYDATHNTDFVEPTSEKALGDEPRGPRHPTAATKPQTSGSDVRTRKPPTVHDQSSNPGLLRTDVVSPTPDRPIPIRMPAQVMRAWIAPWEDARGVLHAGGYSFLEIESRRWSFGETETAEPVRFFSLQNIAVETKEAVGKDRDTSTTRAGTSERLQRPNSSTLPKSGASK